MAALPTPGHPTHSPGGLGVSIWTTDERTSLRDTVTGFVRREILPNLDDWERDGELPRDLHKKAADVGLLGIGFPESVGGSGGDGADVVTVCEAFHEAGASGGAFSSLFTCGIALPHLIAAGDPEQIDRWVRPTLAGEMIGSLAITEPGGGSDVGHLTTTRGARRRPFRGQRREDLHHVRVPRRLRRHRRPHRRSRCRRRVAPGDREGHPGVHRLPQTRQDGLARLRHRRVVLRRRPGSGDQSRRRRELRVHADRTGFRLRTHRPGGAGVRERAALPRPDRRVVP